MAEMLMTGVWQSVLEGLPPVCDGTDDRVVTVGLLLCAELADKTDVVDVMLTVDVVVWVGRLGGLEAWDPGHGL